jgi:hypothetical protein
VRATSWLAGWVDYGVAIVLVAGRLLRIPVRAAESEFKPAHLRLAADGYDGYAPEPFDRPRRRHPQAPSQPWFVRPAEIVMLSISFFLAAHLLSGGTASVSAPQLNPFSMLSTTASAGQVSTLLVPSAKSVAPAASLTVTVESAVEAVTEEVAVEQPAAEAPAPEPVPAAAPDSGPSAASVSAEAIPAPAQSVPEPAPAPAAEPAPAPAPAPAAVAAPPPPVAAASVLSFSEIMAAAAAAGWPADRLDDVSRVAWCESRFRPDAVGYGTYGLMQLIPYWFEATGTDFALWSDPVTNLHVALFAFAADIEYGKTPWGPWSCKPEQITLP